MKWRTGEMKHRIGRVLLSIGEWFNRVGKKLVRVPWYIQVAKGDELTKLGSIYGFFRPTDDEFREHITDGVKLHSKTHNIYGDTR